MMGVQFVQHVAVDIDEIAAVGALSDAMKIRYLVEQSPGQVDGMAEILRLLSTGHAWTEQTSREEDTMPRVVGIDHLVLSVGDFARSKEFYDTLLKFLGFKLKHDYGDMAGWSNGKTLLWIAAADAEPGSINIAKVTSAFITTRSSFRAARTSTRSAPFSN